MCHTWWLMVIGVSCSQHSQVEVQAGGRGGGCPNSMPCQAAAAAGMPARLISTHQTTCCPVTLQEAQDSLCRCMCTTDSITNSRVCGYPVV
jgi:hypothetical protein